MKRWFNNAVVGGAFGAAAVITGLVLLSAFVPGRSLDTISVGILVPAYVLLATLILANTNNSIDTRVRATLDRYESDYKAEIATNQKERQAAMDKAAETMRTEVLGPLGNLQKDQKTFTLRMFALVVLLGVIILLGQHDTVTWLRKRMTRPR